MSSGASSGADGSSLAPPVRRRWQDVDGGRLAVTELGPADAPAMLVAHGAGSSARFVEDAFVDAVIGAGWRLITYDARGHGASSPARAIAGHHLDVHTADLASVVDGTDGEVAVVGGVSLGAHAAVRSVAGGSVRAQAVLACLPAWTGVARRGDGPHAVIAAEVRRVGVEGMLARLRSEQELPAWLAAVLLRDLPRHDPASLRAALLSLDGGQAPEHEELARLPVPLAVVGWAGDAGHPIEVAERWSTVAPQGHLVRLSLVDLESGVGALGAAAVEALRIGEVGSLPLQP